MNFSTGKAEVAALTTNDPRWPAVIARDAQADGKFYYSVKTTGVYCRPSCAARRARPENVRFHATREAAEEAGFRPCKRCRPEGASPAEQRSGDDMWYAIGQSSLGAVLLAGTGRGVCAILIGDDPALLVSDLQKRFPRAKLTRDEGGAEDLVRKVVGLIEKPQRGLDLRFEMRGTAFQQRVWQALRQIPAGSIATYGQIAEKLGAPKSVRAVAQACAANAIAVAIPCHRVVGRDGSLSGYRWGVARKRALLKREAHA